MDVQNTRQWKQVVFWHHWLYKVSPFSLENAQNKVCCLNNCLEHLSALSENDDPALSYIIQYCHSPGYWTSSSLGWYVLCGNSGSESAAPFPKLKCDHHYCRVGFLVQWSAHCETQKTSATVFPVPFFFSPPPLPVVLLSYKELLLLCFLSTVKVTLWFRWLISPILYRRDIFTLCSKAITVPLQCVTFIFMYSASLTEALLLHKSLGNRPSVSFRCTFSQQPLLCSIH